VWKAGASCTTTAEAWTWRTGKLIVVADDVQVSALQAIAERARVNGLSMSDDALRWRG
jgi:L-2-hydroxyglutarate oxidase LhgO